MKRVFAAALAACSCLVLFWGCQNDISFPHSGPSLTVMTWNVQTLMDGSFTGTEFDEYRADSWNDAAYRRRLDTTLTLLMSSALPRADILILQEVENPGVVADLLADGLAAHGGYLWYGAAGAAGGAVQTAVISRYQPQQISVHGTDGIRPVIEAVFQTEGGRVVMWAVHAKSRREGASETEPQRISMSRIISERARIWRDKDKNALLIVAGDLNEDCKAVLKDGSSSFQTALVGSNAPLAGLWRSHGSLVLAGSWEGLQDETWYCPWLDERLQPSRPGSYRYGGEWLAYDGILVRGLAARGWRVGSFDCTAPTWATTIEGAPDRWDVRLKRGVSDHFPLWCTFEY